MLWNAFILQKFLLILKYKREVNTLQLFIGEIDTELLQRVDTFSKVLESENIQKSNGINLIL